MSKSFKALGLAVGALALAHITGHGANQGHQ